MTTAYDASIDTTRNAVSDVLTESVRNYLRIQRAFAECSDEIQQVIRDMVEVFNASDSTEQEKNSALYTIVEAVFPEVAQEVCDQCERIRKAPKSSEYNQKLQQQERHFSEKVRQVMRSKGITQEQLAERIGIGQSAISNLLTRACRPQNRTIEKIAKALDVPNSDLWRDIAQT